MLLSIAVFYLVLSGKIQRVFADGLSDTWDFSVSGDYTVSSGVEVASSNAHLKVQNYTSDVNTAALYHLDEALGAVVSVTDSSSNANTLTITNGTSVAGNLNNALSFNGSTSYAVAPDIGATSLTGNFTIEAWTKFDSGFSSTTSRYRQGVLDKGVYQLYYDNETGKVVFEMTPSSANQWTQAAGPDMLNTNGVSVNVEMNRSWDVNSKNFVWRQIAVGSDIYVALGSATSGTTVTGDAEVWKCTDCATSPVWTKIGGDGLNSGWADGIYEDASALASDGTNIYVGLGNTPGGEGEVWRWNGSGWTQVGGDGLNSSWTTVGAYERVTTMVADGTTIYAGLGLSAGDAEVWKCTSCNGGSPSWSKIGGDGTGSGGQSWTTNTYEDVSALTIVNGTTLAVGLGTGAGDAELWTCATSSCTVTTGWTKRGGDATGSGGQSWSNVTDEIRSLTSSGTVIYVGTGVTAGEADVWRCDLGGTCTTTSGWTQVGGDGLNTSWTASTYERVWSLLASGTTVYAGIGDTAGDAEVWKCINCSTVPVWTQIGGDGNGIPPQSFGNQTGASFLYAASLELIGNNLFVGASSGAGTSGAEIWQCDVSGICSATLGWTRIAGNYLNKSWGTFNLSSVESMTTVSGKLYAGTGYDTGAATANGNAQVWEFDGTSWSMIGGQGINNSWTYGHPSATTATYRAITSMIGYNGTLVVGLGGSTNGDAEAWKWDGATWTKIGGDGTGSGGQSWAAGTKRSVPSMTVIGSKLYAGLQGTAAGDGELWTCDLAATCTTTAGWTFVGGDATGAGGQSWNNTMFEAVWSLTFRGTSVYVGLGSSAGDAEVWTCNTGATCTQTAGWTKLGGDALSSSWANSTYETVGSLTWYRGDLYAGLGASAGDAEIWKWNGTNWGGVAVAGDGLNGTWTNGLYERVKAMTSFNGDLIISLGDSAGEGEVWKYDTSAWSRIGGDGSFSGWTNVVERVNALAVYNGKLYAGTGLSVNSDATIWAYGGNIMVQSSATSQDSSWHHLAVTYDGSNARLYIDGSEQGSVSTSATMLNTAHPLFIGGLVGQAGAGKGPSLMTGTLDEIRISNTVRGSFQTAPYSSGYETVQPTAAIRTSGVKNWDSLAIAEGVPGVITYRLSDNGGTTWKYWDGGAWAVSSGYAQANNEATISANLLSFPVTTGGFLWQAILDGDGNELVTLDTVDLVATPDAVAPAWPGTPTLVAKNQSGGATDISTGTWYAYSAPYFEWSAATDTGGSGVAGYYVYFGTSSGAEPTTSGDFQAGNSYTATTDTDGNALVSGQKYYLIVKARDNAQNTGVVFPVAFEYRYDSTPPTNPLGVTAAPAVYSPDNDFSFLWNNGTDGNNSSATNSLVAGYQYQVGATAASDGWSATTTDLLVNIPGAAYQTGENFFYLRTIDNAGNISATNVRTSFYYAGSGPTAPQDLVVAPTSNTANSFAFSWSPPFSFSGDASTLTYCYTINTLPSEDTCVFTSAGAESLAAAAFATQKNNTFYVAAKNSEELGGVINYGAYASVEFEADTSAPGIPLNTDIADVSVKNTESWKIALSWEAPADIGSGVDSYQIYHSDDGTAYSKVASTSGIAFVDTGLTQDTHYYKIRACDNVNNCGAFTEPVSLYPTGKYTEAASLSGGPTVSLVTTKSATITWATDRTSDSKVQYGKSSGSYFSEEPSNSEQVTEHTIKLSNLSPGTTYSFRTRWTDEDGNTGLSAEKSFKTSPAPTVVDPKVSKVGLTNAILEFTTKGSDKVKIYYGTTEAFGLVKEIATSQSETTYTTSIDDLVDGTKYYYKINTMDTEEEEYEGNTLSFETLPRPKINEVRIQQVKGTAQTVLLISWVTNTETSSIVTYYPEGNLGDARDEVDVKPVKGEHKILIRSLLPQTPYALVVKGRDNFGNEASSDVQRFTTATDTRAPQITETNVEGVIVPAANGDQAAAEAQLVVSWTTDESSTAQVEYGEGTGSVYQQKTQEDSALVSNHTVVISKLAPSKVYHLRMLSKDKAGNIGQSIDVVSITPKATENALDIVFSSLKSIFGR